MRGPRPIRRTPIEILCPGLSLLLFVGGCRPDFPAEIPGSVGFIDRTIPVDELRWGVALAILVVRAEEDLPVIGVHVEIPSQVDSLVYFHYDDWLKGAVINPDPEPRRSTYLRRGAIPPGRAERLGLIMGHREARVGDTLSFPVKVVLSDRSVVDWTGPPGSERPAPRVVVAKPPLGISAPGRFLVVYALGGLALLVLSATALSMARRRWRGRRRASPSSAGYPKDLR